MEIKFYGANCVRVFTKNTSLTIDDNLKSLGAKSVAKPEDTLLFTGRDCAKDYLGAHDKFIIQEPGEYELGSVMVQGFAAKSHIDNETDQSSVIFRLVVERTVIAILGHIDADLPDDVIEGLGMVDILIIPIGGNGYTLDAHDAIKLAHKIDPKVIIPTHFEDASLKYEVPQAPLEKYTVELNQEVESLDSIKLKAGTLLDTGTTKTIVLNKS